MIFVWAYIAYRLEGDAFFQMLLLPGATQPPFRIDDTLPKCFAGSYAAVFLCDWRKRHHAVVNVAKKIFFANALELKERRRVH